MTKPFRLAFLGIDHPHGSSWRVLLNHLSSQVEITAIVPGFGGETTSLEERYADVTQFDTVDELIESGQFDGAFVFLPNNESGPAIVKLAEAGKHVFVEKPGVGSAAQAQPIVDALAKAGVAFQSGYLSRYDEAVNRLRQMVRRHRFGKLISIEMTMFTSDVKRRDPDHYLFDHSVSTGGFFNWLACHYLDRLFYIIGQPVVGVTARTGVFGATPVDVEDGGVAILDLECGAIATFLGGYWLPRWSGEGDWCIRGSQRWVHFHGGALEIHGPQPQWEAMEETFTLPKDDDTPGYGGRTGVAAVNDWLDAARHNGRACRNTAKSALATLQVIDLIYQSSSEGRRIECRVEPS